VGDKAGPEVTFNPSAPGHPAPITIDNGGTLTGVACPSASQCTAVGDHGREVTFDPTAPGNPAAHAIDGFHGENESGADLSAVACPTASQCIAVVIATKKFALHR